MKAERAVQKERNCGSGGMKDGSDWRWGCKDRTPLTFWRA